MLTPHNAFVLLLAALLSFSLAACDQDPPVASVPSGDDKYQSGSVYCEQVRQTVKKCYADCWDGAQASNDQQRTAICTNKCLAGPEWCRCTRDTPIFATCGRKRPTGPYDSFYAN